MLEMFIGLFLDFVDPVSKVEMYNTRAQTISTKITCYFNTKRVFNGYLLGIVEIKVGRKNIMAYRFYNKKTRRMNTVYASTCNIVNEV